MELWNELIATILAVLFAALVAFVKQAVNSKRAKDWAAGLKDGNEVVYYMATHLAELAVREAKEAGNEFVEGDDYDHLKFRLHEYAKRFQAKTGIKVADILEPANLDAILRSALADVWRQDGTGDQDNRKVEFSGPPKPMIESKTATMNLHLDDESVDRLRTMTKEVVDAAIEAEKRDAHDFRMQTGRYAPGQSEEDPEGSGT